MARIIILVAVLAIALILWHKISRAQGAEKKKMVMWSIISGIIAVLLVLAVTGHLNIITAMLASLVALLPRLAGLLRYLPILGKLYQQRQQSQYSQNSQQPPPGGKQGMSRDEAMEVLGLKAGFTSDDVIQAHRRMMQKVHPDRGGSDYLASKINKAKDTLLG
jgi:small-conductance mechanosensitive channel